MDADNVYSWNKYFYLNLQQPIDVLKGMDICISIENIELPSYVIIKMTFISPTGYNRLFC